jgi:hypothetical protein
MTENTYIILIGFDTLQNGIDYMVSSPYKLAFSVDGQTYDYLGNAITTPSESEVIAEGSIWICDCDNPVSGDLYVSDGFLKYNKIIYT